MARGDDLAPSVLAAAPPIDDHAVRERAFEVRVACGETCNVSDATFYDADYGEPAPSDVRTPNVTPANQPPSRQLEDDVEGDPAHIEFDASARPTERYDVSLSDEQANWLAQQLACNADGQRPGCGPTISLSVLDTAGHETEISVPLVSDS